MSESEIGNAVRLLVHCHHMLVEGAAGVAVAGFVQLAPRFENKNIVIVICGANIDPLVLKELL